MQIYIFQVCFSEIKKIFLTVISFPSNRTQSVYLVSELWMWVVNVSCECELWMWVVNASCECELWVWVVNASCECELWVWVVSVSCECELWMRVVNASCECELWMRVVSVSCECELWMRIVNASCECLCHIITTYSLVAYTLHYKHELQIVLPNMLAVLVRRSFHYFGHSLSSLSTRNWIAFVYLTFPYARQHIWRH